MSTVQKQTRSKRIKQRSKNTRTNKHKLLIAETPEASLMTGSIILRWITAALTRTLTRTLTTKTWWVQAGTGEAWRRRGMTGRHQPRQRPPEQGIMAGSAQGCREQDSVHWETAEPCSVASVPSSTSGAHSGAAASIPHWVPPRRGGTQSTCAAQST